MNQPVTTVFRSQTTTVPWQTSRSEPIVAHVIGGGTSGVLLRGGSQVSPGGVRVSLEERATSGEPSFELSATTTPR